MPDSRTAFLSAADSFVSQVAAIPLAALCGPGLGEWDLRSLVGHTSRSLVTVETYLDRPADSVDVPDAAAYYRRVAEAGGAGGTEVTERGRQAGAALGDDPAGSVRDLRSRVADKLTSYGDDYVLVTIAGGMRLDEYLRTRTFELTVHGLDIGAASGADPGFEIGALADAATLAAEVAATVGRAPDMLLAVTGRRSLPAGFSIL